MDLSFELVRGRDIKVHDRESGRTVTLHRDDRISGDRLLAYDLHRALRQHETVEQFIRREYEAGRRHEEEQRRIREARSRNPEWTDEVILDFLRTFLPNADAAFSDSSRSGFRVEYLEWCKRQCIKPNNEHGGYSFYGTLDDLIWNCGHPDDAWNIFKLTEKGWALLKRHQP